MKSKSSPNQFGKVYQSSDNRYDDVPLINIDGMLIVRQTEHVTIMDKLYALTTNYPKALLIEKK